MSSLAPVRQVSPSEIARLAEVSPSTVSNWRARDLGFPSPVNEDAARPLFDVDQVTAWLRQRDKKISGRNDRPAWILANSLRGQVSTERYHQVAIPLICAEEHLRRSDSPLQSRREPFNGEQAMRTAARELELTHPAVASAIYKAIDSLGARSERVFVDIRTILSNVDELHKLAEDLIDLSLENARHGVVEYLTARPLADLLSGLVLDRARTFADLASGGGETLLAAHRRRPEMRLFGQDINRSAVELAQCRMYLENIEADLQCGDATQANMGTFDAVVIHAPFGMRVDSPSLQHMPFLSFGVPQSSRADLLWPQLAFHALAPGGTAAIMLTHGALFASGRSRDILDRFLSQDLVNAIIDLPAGALLGTNMKAIVFVISKPPRNTPRGEVLMIEAPSVSRNEGLTEGSVKDVLELVESWRNGRFESSSSSIVVPVQQLLAPGAPLLPSAWLAIENVADSGELLSRIEENYGKTLAALDSARTITNRPLHAEMRSVAATTETLKLLALTALRGITESHALEDGADERTSRERVVTLSAVRTGRFAERAIHPLISTKAEVRTRAGDIAVAGMGRPIYARVCEESGVLVDKNVYLIRPNPDRFDAHYLAQAIMADANQGFVGGATIQRTVISQLRVPVIPLSEQRAFGDAIREAEAIAIRADAVLLASRLTLESLRDGFATIRLIEGDGEVGMEIE